MKAVIVYTERHKRLGECTRECTTWIRGLQVLMGDATKVDENNRAEVLWNSSCWPTSQTQWWTIVRIDVSFPEDSNTSKKEHT